MEYKVITTEKDQELVYTTPSYANAMHAANLHIQDGGLTVTVRGETGFTYLYFDRSLYESNHMTVAEMFSNAWTHNDVDVYEDVTDGIGVAFCGDLRLTEMGKERFRLVLDDDVEIDGSYATVHIDQYDDWTKHKAVLTELFYSAAGYCSVEDYDRWFIDID